MPSASGVHDLDPGAEAAWRDFVAASPAADYCHDLAWREVIASTYGASPGYLIDRGAGGELLGVCPAFRLKSLAGKGSWVCLPFLDYGGPLSGDAGSLGRLAAALRERAAAQRMPLEIRSSHPLAGLDLVPNEKVAMVLPLEPGGQEAYWKSLDAKVRNQVRKAEKSKVEVRWGREELLDDFYSVFAVNMRDLGSPVHARALFANVLRHFPGAAVGTAYREGRCIGGLFRILWKKTLAIPWASTLKEERVHSPNNALYWESIRFAYASDCRAVDFGRSSKGEGTYKFKLQWLAQESPLCWYPFDAQGQPKGRVDHLASGKLQLAARIWSRLPLPVANLLGPTIRKSLPA
jgi:serine/alanine adding enzyme